VKAFIVHAHPEPESFCGALTNTAVAKLKAEGHEVVVSDLYRMSFNPVSDRRNFTTVKDAHYYKQQMEELHATEVGGFAADIKAELDKLEWCDTLIFQFPLWWFGLPAIQKGWVDKVFAMGATYGRDMRYANGRFKGKRALASLTTGGPPEGYLPNGESGDINKILFPITHGMFYFVGFTPVPSHVVYGPVRMSEEQRKQALADYADYVSRIWEMEAIKW
jgi:NAD(P)H dehydrogenase (quinone)